MMGLIDAGPATRPESWPGLGGVERGRERAAHH